jgi:hypothetical protein
MLDKIEAKNQTSTVVTPSLQVGRSTNDTSFKPGRGGSRAGSGRPRGSPNKITNTFRDVLLQAVSEVGTSREVGVDGEGGLLGYLKVAAVREERAVLMLLGRILPLKITTEVKKLKETMTIEEAVADLKACGMEPMLALYLKRYPIERDEGDPEWAKMIDVSLAPDPLVDTVALEENGTGFATALVSKESGEPGDTPEVIRDRAYTWQANEALRLAHENELAPVNPKVVIRAAKAEITETHVKAAREVAQAWDHLANQLERLRGNCGSPAGVPLSVGAS